MTKRDTGIVTSVLEASAAPTPAGDSIRALLAASERHCSLAVTRGAPVEYRLRHLDQAQRAVLQVLAVINGACGVAPPRPPRGDRGDRHAVLPVEGRTTWNPGA